ncbi:MAG: Flp pilus assembly complex ATPase component TadA, partial [Deltaproteobacteria bacterium]|nr:Flp pilus assembly complex ATPase component TadA [Deltaproteobacteria bacterium]
MQIAIHNTLSGARSTLPLEGETVTIGRPDPPNAVPNVPVPGKMVSRQQAVLYSDDGGWTLEHVGVNETLLGTVSLNPGKRYKVRPGDEIRIGQYVLSLFEDLAPEVQDEFRAREVEFLDFESKIHDRLLDLMDLRRGESTADLESPETRERIVGYLDRLLGETIAGAKSELLDHVLRTAVHRRITWRVTASGSNRTHQERRDADPQGAVYEEILRDILDRMGVSLGLSFDPKQMQEDSEALDRGFEKEFESRALEFSEGLREHLVRSCVRQDLLDVIFGLGPLQDLMEMEGISEVMVVARDQIFIEKFGVIEDARRAFFSDDLLIGAIERIVAPIGRRIDKSSPIVDAHLPDGSRVNAVIPPLALKGPCLTIRKFSKSPLGVSDLVRFGALSEQMAKFIRACVGSHKNTIVSGGTGSGKTTLLNGLSSFIGPKERIVTIEDTAELQLKQAHVVTLESRPPNMEGKGEVTIRDLVKNALRMRPDRIVVGECRGGEALDMLQAMNTGHDGSMTTGHANTPTEMMLRL